MFRFQVLSQAITRMKQEASRSYWSLVWLVLRSRRWRRHVLETSADFKRTRWCYIPEDGIYHVHVFVVYSNAPVCQATTRPVIGGLLENELERIWKEAFMV
jgi:hypothetical protein